jgi:hypothetical protein
MRALLLCALVAGVVGVGIFACNPNSIGRPCVNPGGQTVISPQISSPALECPSRLCLLQPAAGTGGADGGYRATCTADCQHDSDCDPETKEQCKQGFVCAVATQTGPYCCKKICVCRADLVEGTNVDADGGTITPFSCIYDPTFNPNPSCPNFVKP